jgi:hypothetical protein
LGLTGQISAYNLHYSFNQEQIDKYLKQGYSKQKALDKASMDLGYGDGRGIYIKYVYGNY